MFDKHTNKPQNVSFKLLLGVSENYWDSSSLCLSYYSRLLLTYMAMSVSIVAMPDLIGFLYGIKYEKF